MRRPAARTPATFRAGRGGPGTGRGHRSDPRAEIPAAGPGGRRPAEDPARRRGCGIIEARSEQAGPLSFVIGMEGSFAMAVNEPVPTLFSFIIDDFKAAWNAIVKTGATSGGNFLFARQAMTLLEVTCRLCRSDNTGQALQDFSDELARRDRRYFTKLPGSCWSPDKRAEFYLPSQCGINNSNNSELIAALFDLIRHGQAHQYQQILVRLSDGRDFGFEVTGAGPPSPSLDQTFAQGRPPDHLKASQDSNGDLWVKIRTDVLFLDVREAIEAANLLGRGLTLTYLQHPQSTKSLHYRFSCQDLESKLQRGGHF